MLGKFSGKELVFWHKRHVFGVHLAAFPFSGRNLGVKQPQSFSRQDQIGQGKQGEELCCILGHTPVTGLAMFEQVLDDMEGMFNLGPDLGLGILDLFQQMAQRGIRQRPPGSGAQGNVPGNGGVLVFFPLLYADIARIPMDMRLFAVQQGVGLGDIVNIGGGGHHGMRQTRFGIHANVRLHTEVPVVALLGLVHLGIAVPILVFGGTGGCDDRRIDHGPFLEHQAFFGQVAVNGVKHGASQFVRFQQASKLEQGGGVRSRFPAEVDADKAADGLAVVEGIFDPFIRQANTLLRNVHAQHPFQADRRPAATIALGVVRRDRRHQRSPRGHRFDLAQKTVPTRHPFLG